MTAEVSIISILGSFIVGVLIALLRMSQTKAVNIFARFYIDFFRNVPFIVLVFFAYYGLPEIGIYIDAFWTGCVTLSVAVGAYVAETIRAGILSIDKGVVEAARSFGISRFKIYKEIVMPMALAVSVKPLGSVFINLILTTSILSAITLNELTGASKIIASTTFRPFEVYVFLVLFYGMLTFILSGLFSMWHRSLNQFKSQGV